MESQDRLITLEICSSPKTSRKRYLPRGRRVGEDRFQKANDGRQAQQRDLVLHSPIRMYEADPKGTRQNSTKPSNT